MLAATGRKEATRVSRGSAVAHAVVIFASLHARLYSRLDELGEAKNTTCLATLFFAHWSRQNRTVESAIIFQWSAMVKTTRHDIVGWTAMRSHGPHINGSSHTNIEAIPVQILLFKLPNRLL